MITDIEDFFAKGCGRCERFDTPQCSTKRWAAGLAALRRLALAAGLQEMVKWGHPCYMHAGRNILIFGAFQQDFRLTFFDAGLLKDPEGILEKPGPFSATSSMIRFTDNAEVAAMEQTILAYIAEAMGYAEAGIKPPKVESEIETPEELTEALDSDPELAEAFHNLTPGRQKSYLINLNGAKQPATRLSRIAAFRPKILAGKGALDR
jgi:uncharacterized protein YdeI (YjbR/CyaY-like superfamily)